MTEPSQSLSHLHQSRKPLKGRGRTTRGRSAERVPSISPQAPSRNYHLIPYIHTGPIAVLIFIPSHILQCINKHRFVVCLFFNSCPCLWYCRFTGQQWEVAEMGFSRVNLPQLLIRLAVYCCWDSGLLVRPLPVLYLPARF